MDEHEHQWGRVEVARFSGTPHRKCQVSGCKVISLSDLPADTSAYVTTATELGADAGESAASWYLDGNNFDRAYHLVILQGIEDGDPAVLDTFPTSALLGEWADGLTIPDLLEQVTGSRDYDGDDSDDICQAFEDAYDRAVHATIEATCREMLS